MRRLLTLLFPALAAAVLMLGAASARADMCGGTHYTAPVDSGTPPATDGGMAWKSKLPRQVGAGFLFAAAVSTGWLCFRRKGPGEK